MNLVVGKHCLLFSEISVFLYLQARQYKDFIALLPEHIALKILSYLTVKELLRSCMVRFVNIDFLREYLLSSLYTNNGSFDGLKF